MKARKRIAPHVVKPANTEKTQPTRLYFIYGLTRKIDQGPRFKPITQVFYVGMTNDPKGRYLQHLAGDENVRKTQRIRESQKYGDIIDMTILDTTLDIEEARQLEAFWILYHTLCRSPLTNTHAGSLLSWFDLDKSHTERLRKMLHDEYGCCPSADCMYDIEVKPARKVGL